MGKIGSYTRALTKLLYEGEQHVLREQTARGTLAALVEDEAGVDHLAGGQNQGKAVSRQGNLEGFFETPLSKMPADGLLEFLQAVNIRKKK